MKDSGIAPLLWALLLISLWPAAARGGEVIAIPPRQDACVDGASTVLLDGELVVGFRAFVNQNQEYQIALEFNLPPGLTSNQIESATLRLHYFDAWGSFKPRLIRAHGILASWNASNLPAFIAHGPELSGVEVGGEFRPVSWDVTSAARAWAANAALNHGLLLVAESSGLDDNALRFHSSRSRQSALHPMLEVAYAPAPVSSPTRPARPQTEQVTDRDTWWMVAVPALLVVLIIIVMLMRRKKLAR